MCFYCLHNVWYLRPKLTIYFTNTSMLLIIYNKTEIKRNSYYHTIYAYSVLVLPKLLNYLAFQSFDFQRTWWRFFQKQWTISPRGYHPPSSQSYDTDMVY